MGILIPFPQPGTRTLPGHLPSSQSEAQDVRHAAAYRLDLDRAVALLLEHVQSDAYDGIALILRPISLAHKPALVVGGFYRHRLKEAMDATMQLHLAIKLRAREQDIESESYDSANCRRYRPNPQEGDSDQVMQATLLEKWNDATARYRRCEQMLRMAFSKQLRASPETTAILLTITQLNVEIVANCLCELVRQPGRATPQAKLETLKAIKLFQSVRAQVSAWMPPAGQEAAYFAANATAFSEEMILLGDALLVSVENALRGIILDSPKASVGT
ncbi:hypothetical protein [Ralstonia sp.]|uniref:hypothetical protein n=1 Tax=Ralstonia sp. TaxID=54061 RepID=UPI002D0C797B|nr:hypothetical protein [Ralstonia sp.]HWV04980.1 hypothetical protein [Ralstonia sp.]